MSTIFRFEISQLREVLASFKAAPSSEGNNPKAEAEADNLTNDLLFIIKNYMS
jgi:hypothetical protein